MFKHKSGLGGHPSLFDIRVRLQHKDVLLLRGNEFEVESVPFSGLVKLLIPCDMHVRKIKLVLEGEFGVQYVVKGGSFVIERLCCLRVVWKNLLTSADGDIVFGAYGDTLEHAHALDKKLHSHSHSSSRAQSPSHPNSPSKPAGPAPIERPRFTRSWSLPLSSPPPSLAAKVLTPTNGCDGTPFDGQKILAHHTFCLTKGNYDLPFTVFLPTNVSETVEGLPSGRLMYRMTCSIERGRFEKPITTSKVIRIVRTLHPQSFSLLETVDLNSAWLGKVQYSVSLERKGIAIGSTVPIKIVMVPLVKGLSLLKVTGSLVERLHVVTPVEGMLPQWERVVGTQSLTIPANLVADNMDQWVVDTTYQVPHRLSDITQSCTLKGGIIEVKHRLRLEMQITNSDGHVSELRAQIPVVVYISAHVGSATGFHYDWDATQGFIADRKREVAWFKRREEEHDSAALGSSAEVSGHSTPARSTSPGLGGDGFPDAPPVYHRHIFDQLYDLSRTRSADILSRVVSGAGTPVNLGSVSPLGMTSPNTLVPNIGGYFDEPGSGPLHPLMSPPLAVLNRIPSYDFAASRDDNEDSLDTIEPAPGYEGEEDVTRPGGCASEGANALEAAGMRKLPLLLRLHHQHHIALSKILAKKKTKS